MSISIQNSVAFVSGANRGIGKAIAEELLNKGVKKVYAAARKPEQLDALKAKHAGRLVPVQLDVTDQQSVDAAARQAQDVTMLINNAGVLVTGCFTSGNMLDCLDQNHDVNVRGVARLTQAFLPTIQEQSEPVIATVASVVGLANMPVASGYSVSKAAVHSMIQGMRGELKPKNIHVAGIYPGPIDTDMAKDFEDVQKDSPEFLAKNVVSALEQGEEDIFPDTMSAQIKEAYFAAPKEVEKMFSTWV